MNNNERKLENKKYILLSSIIFSIIGILMFNMSTVEIINFINNIESEESSVNFSRSSIALTSGSMLFVFFSCYSLVALIRNKKFSKKTNDVILKMFFIISLISIISPYPVSYYLEKIALENGYEYSGKLSQSWLYDKNYVYIK
ncbi:DUF1240 domain-containing protein [Vibrio campbellii]|uniref:DUF1240 domain-containing protein n=1 Tax=Vibrio campbellii TaxID=680 RepID=UPI001E3A71D4|nr:DUF1240 domain-containing protein [Vibrio campbellii]MCC8254276.1 DUF1240 domain-containing protein [Vibrio campbellii CAIM 333]